MGFTIKDGVLKQITGKDEIVKIPEEVKVIDGRALNLKYAKELHIPSGVQEISAGNFLDFSVVERIYFSSGLKMIGEYAFSNYSELKELNLPIGLQKIGGHAFYGSAMQEIYIPSSVYEIGVAAFGNDVCVKKIRLDKGNVFFLVKDTMILTADGKELVCSLGKGDVLSIPNTVCEIHEQGVNCKNWKKIILPNSIQRFNEKSFVMGREEPQFFVAVSDNIVLEKSIPVYMKYIDACITESGFDFNLYDKKLSGIKDVAYKLLYALKRIQFFGDDDKIMNQMSSFAKRNLEKILPNLAQESEIEMMIRLLFNDGSEKEIEIVRAAVALCKTGDLSALQKIFTKEGTKKPKKSIVGKQAPLKNVAGERITEEDAIKCWETKIGDEGKIVITKYLSSYTGGTNMSNPEKQVKIPAKIGEREVVELGDHAFLLDWTIESMEIPNTIMRIGKNAVGCKNLKEVIIPDSVTVIDDFAFCDCGVKKITLGKKIRRLGEGVFCRCEHLKEIYLPKNIKKISVRAFAECKNLERVVIENGVARIDKKAFFDCSKLKVVEIPESVTYIADDAFFGCLKIQFICKPGSYAERFLKKDKK